ncbi:MULTISPECIES: hypothetical protein [Leuconostoc]|uniref:Uncharacterized protein n=1 Tax=Leuconostoc kimchii (strain IMSNU 11154 / KCTC 2386 / IH25) TaxID=762051 RepID=D5T3B2_LEUKI|nr:MULTISPECIES: hypothetical protein [Leuconostoc]ADG40761.1 hypothetical protein LKI_06105 [Leuconostoc kimchii IMSNU 11154]AEJ31263.1 hypothetical protein LGMK_06030 [Leuconostoc sp. C2]
MKTNTSVKIVSEIRAHNLGEMIMSAVEKSPEQTITYVVAIKLGFSEKEYEQ